ncbi:TAXI family TRAP transporter solute-binding subunit [Streptomyces hokutonensis]|uniref:TAXI family TRAP transporter solute-binding subunit n=1 Tax=Streptomyces hokutonensis TaxID=1306990 RepID=UPI000363CBF0|nr:TAXI family TRAP transporter solute-binding subunit [Streptomyces hokutonensis]
MSSPIEVRLLTSGANWLRVGSMIGLGLTGYNSPLPEGSSVSIHTIDTGKSCMRGMQLVDDGTYDFGMTSPPWLAKAAADGVTAFGLTDRPLNLRAVCVFPHFDQLALAVRADLGITSLRQIFEEKIPLRISTGPTHLGHPLGWVMDLLYDEYGVSVEDIEGWGGTVSSGERQLNFLEVTDGGLTGRAALLADGKLDAVFDEGIMSKSWLELAEAVPMTFLPVEDEVLSSLEAKYGARRTVLPAGRLPGIGSDVPTIDFAGWMLYCRADVDDELVLLALQGLEQQLPQMETLFESQGAHKGLSEPVDLAKTWQNAELPLHPGAERFYRSRGYM